MRRIVALVLLLAVAAPLGGCIIAEPGPYYGEGHGRWCSYHPWRC